MAQPDQMKMMRKIAQMQSDMAAAQEALGNETVEGSAGGNFLVSSRGDLTLRETRGRVTFREPRPSHRAAPSSPGDRVRTGRQTRSDPRRDRI